MDVGTNGKGISEYRAVTGPHGVGDSPCHAHPVASAKTAEIPMQRTSREMKSKKPLLALRLQAYPSLRCGLFCMMLLIVMEANGRLTGHLMGIC
jgi:hypothetical protein